jgi:hypothetical protein
MLFTGDALEQATDYRVAARRAARFQGIGLAADLGCGIGGDTIWLAGAADRVWGIDLDETRLIFARHNCAEYNLADKVSFTRADVIRLPGSSASVSAFFADPARRSAQGKRVFDPNHYSPPLDKLTATYKNRPLGIKVGPGLDFDTVPTVDEIEVVSLAGEVKEAVLWFNGLATPGISRRATLLPAGETLTDTGPAICPVERLGDYLYEPDPAVIRAGLVEQLGARLALNRLDPYIAYLSGHRPLISPLVKSYGIEARLPLKIKAINRYLKAHGIGRVNVKQRGTGLIPDQILKQLKLIKTSPIERTLILVRIADDHLALVCRRLASESDVPQEEPG